MVGLAPRQVQVACLRHLQPRQVVKASLVERRRVRNEVVLRQEDADVGRTSHHNNRGRTNNSFRIDMFAYICTSYYY